MHHSIAWCFLFLLKRSFSPGRTGGFQPLPDKKVKSRGFLHGILFYLNIDVKNETILSQREVKKSIIVFPIDWLVDSSRISKLVLAEPW